MLMSTPAKLLRGVLQWQNWTAQDFPSQDLKTKQKQKTNNPQLKNQPC